MADTVAGSDYQPSSESENLISLTMGYKQEAESAKRERLNKNRQNWDAYLSRQDWSHKVEGQSTEFLPKTAVAVEQLVSVFRKGLTQEKNWFTVELGRGSKIPLLPDHMRDLLMHYISKPLVSNGERLPFKSLLIDSLKQGLLSSLIIFKVHGYKHTMRRMGVQPPAPDLERGSPLFPEDENVNAPRTDEDGRIEAQEYEYSPWIPRIDLIRLEDFYFDPTGNNLYEIHECEQDLHYVIERAEEGIYDKSAVAQLKNSFADTSKDVERARQANQETSQTPRSRMRVRLDECWGTILDREGRIVHRNVFWTIANERFIIRKPTPNPFWHQKSPFVVKPLIRVPHSTLHKAVYDEASQLNLAMNELFNLILDGGISSVWGIKQVRLAYLEDPDQISGGIAQGDTIAVKENMPNNMKAVETVAQGQIPTDAMVTYEALNREFTQAGLSNELKLGQFPGRAVKATEVVELTQAQGGVTDSIIDDFEYGVSSVLELTFVNIMQHLEDLDANALVDILGVDRAFALSQMDPAARAELFTGDFSVKVQGLSNIVSRVKEFQKFMGLFQVMGNHPLMAPALFKYYSPMKILRYGIRMLGVDTLELERTEDEMATEQEYAELMAFAQLSRPGQQQGAPGGQEGATEGGGSALQNQLPAEVNQVGNPLTGMGGV